jgi:S-methylmethionine-dependent homocysteine/selenocysteine methylase
VQQARPLLESGLRRLAFETIPSLKEVELVGRVLEEHLLSTAEEEDYEDLEAWIVVTCQDGARTRSGDLFSDVVRLASTFNKVVSVRNKRLYFYSINFTPHNAIN